MFFRKGLFLSIVLLCALYSFSPAQDLVFATRPSATKVGLQNQFQVSFVIQNASNISDFTPPSFDGFRVLGGPFQSSRSNISIVNGHAKRMSSTTLSYVLQPKHKGELTIDGAKVKIGGHEYSSNPVTIQVVPGSVATRHPRRQNPMDPFANDPFQAMQKQMQQMQQMAQQMMQQMGAAHSMPVFPKAKNLTGLDEKNIKNNVFIKVTVDNTHPYVGQQITASYKLYTRLPMNMNLTQLPSLNGFWSEDFDIPNPPKPKIETINGKKYQVFLLKKTALFPQHAGKLTLDPAKAEGTVRVIEKTKNPSPLASDPRFGSLFMNDPFFNNNFFSRYAYKDVQVKLSSKPVTIHVRALPVANQPKSFTGAVGHFTVDAKMDTAVLTTGNSANFVFTIKGRGNFKLIGNPTINFPTSLSALDPMVTDSVISRSPEITGQKTFTYNLSPQQAGQYTIPSVAFSYFDPSSQKYKTLHTQPITVTVKQGTGAPATVAATAAPVSSDIHNNIFKQQHWSANASLFVATPWYWALYIIALIVFIAAWYLNRRREDMAANATLWKNRKANKVAWKRLSVARKLLPQKDAHTAFYEEVSKAVWLYLSGKLSIPISELSKDNIADNLRRKDVGEEQIGQVHALLSECEMALYSRTGGKQQREHTLDNAFKLIGSLERVLQKKKKPLAYHES